MKRELLFLAAGIVLGILLTAFVARRPGRYQIQVAGYKVYTLDTATGQLWGHMVEDTNYLRGRRVYYGTPWKPTHRTD